MRKFDHRTRSRVYNRHLMKCFTEVQFSRLVRFPIWKTKGCINLYRSQFPVKYENKIYDEFGYYPKPNSRLKYDREPYGFRKLYRLRRMKIQ